MESRFAGRPVLVTGGAGFIGSHVVDALVSAGADVHVLDDLSGGRRGNLPPTATLQTNWGWGVGSSRIERLDHQFMRNYPGPGPFGVPYKSTPIWPSDTTQFGVYHVRGPW